MTLKEFKSAYKKLPIGSHMQYHHGLLAIDRLKSFDLDQIAEYIYWLHRRGDIFLYQSRHPSVLGCSYNFIKLAEPGDF